MAKVSRRERDKLKKQLANDERMIAERAEYRKTKPLQVKLAAIHAEHDALDAARQIALAKIPLDRARKDARSCRPELGYKTDIKDMELSEEFLQHLKKQRPHDAMIGIKRRAMSAGILTNGAPNRMGLVNTDEPEHGKERVTRRELVKLEKNIQRKYSK